MLKKIILFSTFILCGALLIGKCAYAGFGISPPYVKTTKPIFPGTSYEQKITLLRSSAEEELQAQITVNAPEIVSWITIDKGDKFDLPVGELQVPMVVRVNVPKNAELGNYKGNINVRIAPKEAGGGGVSIALGARVDIDFTVDNQSFVDFNVRQISLPNLEELKSPWNWPIFRYFFYKIKVISSIENTGNVKAAPTKFRLEVYDLNEAKILEAGDDKSLEKINPFTTADITADFRTKLRAGQYWGKVKIYKDNEIIKSDKIAFTIYSPGKMPGGPPGLGPWPYAMMGGLILSGLLLLLLLVKLKSWRYVYKVILVIFWPLFFIWRKIIIIKNKLAKQFWQWMHSKSSKYKNIDDQEKGDKE